MDRFPRASRGWRWAADQPTRVGVGCVDLGGARFWVDPTAPQIVTAYEAADAEGLAKLVSVFGRDWFHLVAAQGPSFATEDPALAPPALSDAWARLAVVATVDQWSPEPFDEALLLIDKALAWHDCGATDRASALLTLIETTVAELAEAVAMGELVGVSAAEATRAVTLLGTFDDHQDKTDDAGWALVGLPSTQHPFAEPTAARAPDKTELVAEVPVVVDPRYVHPRVLAWAGDSYRVEARAGVGKVVVLIWLSELCPDDAREVRTLRARAVGDRTGTVLPPVAFATPDAAGAVCCTLAVPPGVPDQFRVEIFNDDLAVVNNATEPFDQQQAAEQVASLAQWVSRRRSAVDQCSADEVQSSPRPAAPGMSGRSGPTAPLLAELLLSAPAEGSSDLATSLSDDLIQVNVDAWVMLDLAAALTRSHPTAVEGHRTRERRCVEGEVALPSSLTQAGLQRRATWRYCEDPAELTVRLAPATDRPAAAPPLMLSIGVHSAPFFEDVDGNLTARVYAEPAGRFRIRAKKAAGQ